MKILSRIRNACLKEGIPINNTRDVLMMIRQLEIGFGCPNQCSSCFSAAPQKIIQMKYRCFKKIMCEMGRELKKNNDVLSFFYLGAATDPRAIKKFYKYYKVQCKYSVFFKMIKTFSHGWDLNNKKERKEAKKFLHVFLKKDKIYSKQRLTLSFDQFSLLARKNWEEYLKHFTTNLLFFDRITKLGKLRIEVTYVPDYMKCNPKYRFETIMTGIRQHKYNSYKDIKNDFVKEPIQVVDMEVLRTTKGLLQVLEKVIPFEKIITIVRDNRSIFPAGRGLSYFKNNTDNEKEVYLKNQEEKVLYSIENLPMKYLSLIIKPNGCVNVVDYRGYRFIAQLNNGLPVIPKIKFYEVN